MDQTQSGISGRPAFGREVQIKIFRQFFYKWFNRRGEHPGPKGLFVDAPDIYE